MGLSTVLNGCSSDSDGEGDRMEQASSSDASDVLAEGTRKLTLLSAPAIRLTPGEEAVIEVRYTEGTGVVGEPVSFALMGRAQDSSLAQLDVETGVDGIAVNTLMAGDEIATFQLRVSANGAAPIFIDVAVSDAGFGSLVVFADYDGNRNVIQRTVVVQADLDCGEEAHQPGDPMITLTSDGPAEFLALPADTRYAIMAVAEGPDLDTLAIGCVDAVVVEADTSVEATVAFADEPLVPQGEYDVEVQLDSTNPAATLSQLLEAAAVTRVQADADAMTIGVEVEAGFLLGALDSVLRGDAYADDPEYAAAADALAEELLTPSGSPPLDEALQAALDSAEQGPLRAVATMADAAELSLKQTRLAVTLTLDARDGGFPASWEPSTLEAAPVSDSARPLAIDVSEPSMPASVEARFHADADLLEIVSVNFEVAWGSLAQQVLQAVVNDPELGRDAQLRDTLGCGTFGDWIATQPLLSVCGGKCRRRACDSAITAIVEAAETRLAPVDEERPSMTLQGELTLDDLDGDLEVEHMRTDHLLGTWDAADPDDEMGDAVSGTVEAERIRAMD